MFKIKKLLMAKKGDMPFWLVMAILLLLSMIVIIIIIGSAGGKLNEFTAWLQNIF